MTQNTCPEYECCFTSILKYIIYKSKITGPVNNGNKLNCVTHNINTPY